jgi:uncharacterized OB-fold protein
MSEKPPVRRAEKPLPLADRDAQPYWDGTAQETLLLQRCGACQAYRHPPSPTCPRCFSADHAWVPASGSGTVYSFVVVRRAFNPAWEPDVPYVVAVVQLAEGPKLVTNIVNTPVENVAIGQPVTVTFDHVSDTVALPKFQPASPANNTSST